jgi:multidrug efflux system membrane fusion protein
MGFRGYAGAAALVVAAALAYCAYAPDSIEKWVPAAGGFAHGVHDGLAGGAKARISAQAPADAIPRAAPVSVAAAKRTDYPIYIDGLGQAQAYNTVTVRTRVDGQIEKIAFDEGQMVKAGDLIAQIDPRPFQAALDQAKAKQAQDQANLANAKLDLQRYATLVKQSFATQQQLDTQSALVTPTRRRSTRRKCSSTTPRSARRSPAAPACAWSTRATSSPRRSRRASSPSRKFSRSQ